MSVLSCIEIAKLMRKLNAEALIVQTDRSLEVIDKPKRTLCSLLQTMGSDITTFTLPLWITTAAIFFVYGAMIPISTFVSDILQEKFAISSVKAGGYFGSVYLIAGLILPFVGYAIDKCGRLAFVMCLAALSSLVANLLWINLPNDCSATETCDLIVFIPILFMGFAYGLFAGSSWNAIVYLVEASKYGTANGICSSIMNIGCALFPPLMG